MPYKIYSKNGERYVAEFIGSSNHKNFKKIYNEVMNDYMKNSKYKDVDYNTLDYAIVKAIYNIKNDLFYKFIEDKKR